MKCSIPLALLSVLNSITVDGQSLRGVQQARFLEDSCEDTADNCEDVFGYAPNTCTLVESTREYMQANCKKTCGLCTVSPTRGPCENDPDFLYKQHPGKDCATWVSSKKDTNCRKNQSINGIQTGKQVSFYCPIQCKPKCAPTNTPTNAPTTDAPTNAPTNAPTDAPTNTPTNAPTNTPTNAPTTSAPIAPTPAPVPGTPAPVVNTPAPVISTPAPVVITPAPAPVPEPGPNATRFLVWDGENMIVEEVGGVSDSESNTNHHHHHHQNENKEVHVTVNVNASPFAYEIDRNICHEVDARLINNQANRELCHTYLNLPFIHQHHDNGHESCEEAIAATKIPKVYYSVSATAEESVTQLSIQAYNPDWEHQHYSDAEALEFIQEQCGDDVAQAYECLAPAAYRADLFRFCALYTKGGLYLDSDILPLVKLEELYDPCSVVTIGHDWPQGRPQKQMKILAGQQGAPIFLCMINKIVSNVRSRVYPDNPLALTGPMVLHDCYEEYSEGVSVTYRDTRNAAYPYSGMRGKDGALVAFEVPYQNKNNNDDGQHHHHNYKMDFDLHEVYRPTCLLHKNEDVIEKSWSSSSI